MAQTNTVAKIGIAAGFIKTVEHLDYGVLDTVSHVTFGSFTIDEMPGNPEPNWWFDPVSGKMLNAIKLKNVGLREFLFQDLREIEHAFRNRFARSRISLAPTQGGELRDMCGIMTETAAYWRTAETEANGACPNHRGGASTHPVLAYDVVAVRALLMEFEGYLGKKALKIAPKTPRKTLEAIVDLCGEFGISTLVSGNTLRSSTVVDGVQRICVPQGGMSGRPLLKYALYQARMLREIIEKQNPDLYLVGGGGVLEKSDAIKMLQYADEVSVATLPWNFGIGAVADLVAETNFAL